MKRRKSLVALHMLFASFCSIVACADPHLKTADSSKLQRRESLTEQEKLVMSLAIVGHALMLTADINKLEKARATKLAELQEQASHIPHDKLGDIPGLLEELRNLTKHESQTQGMFEDKAKVVSAKLKVLS